jgi:hypothetical protein
VPHPGHARLGGGPQAAGGEPLGRLQGLERAGERGGALCMGPVGGTACSGCAGGLPGARGSPLPLPARCGRRAASCAPPQTRTHTRARAMSPLHPRLPGGAPTTRATSPSSSYAAPVRSGGRHRRPGSALLSGRGAAHPCPTACCSVSTSDPCCARKAQSSPPHLPSPHPQATWSPPTSRSARTTCCTPSSTATPARPTPWCPRPPTPSAGRARRYNSQESPWLACDCMQHGPRPRFLRFCARPLSSASAAQQPRSPNAAPAALAPRPGYLWHPSRPSTREIFVSAPRHARVAHAMAQPVAPRSPCLEGWRLLTAFGPR